MTSEMRPDDDDGSAAGRFSAWFESLPAEQRGTLILALWANAMLTLALYGAWLLLIVRVLWRLARGGYRAETLLDAVRSRAGTALLGATITHSAARRFAVRRLDRNAREAGG